MQLNVSDQRYVVLPVYGPEGTDLTQYVAQAAIIPEADGEPTPDQYNDAEWVTGQDSPYQLETLVMANSLTGGVSYMAWVTLTAGPEHPVIKCGRILVGAGS